MGMKKNTTMESKWKQDSMLFDAARVEVSNMKIEKSSSKGCI